MNSEKDNFPLVTIAIATFNGAETIEDVLAGILEIDYPNLEVLVGDDHSSDHTLEICEKFRSKMPYLNCLESAERMGINRNYNRLLGIAKGEYFILFDQDDARAATFIPKCVSALENDAGAVLCHSHTGVRWNGKLYHVNTLNSLTTSTTILGRVFYFLRRPSDINIYGVIRTESLRKAGGWKPGLSNTDRLLLALLLQGRFIQIPEVLFWYTAKGLRFRPSPAEEIERSQPNAHRKYLLLPGLRMTMGQSEQIKSSHLSFVIQFSLHFLLFSNFISVLMTKIVYRIVWRILGEATPATFTRICARIVYPEDDIQYIINRNDDPIYFPKEWPLRRVPQTGFPNGAETSNEK